MSETYNIPAALCGLNDWLAREQHSGKTAVWLPGETLERLRDLPQRLSASGSTDSVPTVASNPAVGESAKAMPQVATAAPASKPAVGAAAAPSDDRARRDRLNAFAREAKRDPVCRGLGTLRETMVFASGNPNAELMFVGEAPGYEEERQKKPFVGPAGQLLIRIIEAMGFQREDVYISNIVKFRPMIDDGSRQGRSNRKPSAEEMAASVKYVRSEIDIVAPKVIVALGGTAAAGLLGLDGSIGKLRSQFHDLDGTPVMITYHPSYLLYREKEGPVAFNAEKKKVWADMQMVLEKLGATPAG